MSMAPQTYITTLLPYTTLFRSMGFHSVEAVQLMTEVERIAFADRGEYMGDIDFYSVPVKKLVSEQYLEERMKLFTQMTAGTDRKSTRMNSSHGYISYDVFCLKK